LINNNNLSEQAYDTTEQARQDKPTIERSDDANKGSESIIESMRRN
jgi:hypothetical protein